MTVHAADQVIDHSESWRLQVATLLSSGICRQVQSNQTLLECSTKGAGCQHCECHG